MTTINPYEPSSYTSYQYCEPNANSLKLSQSIPQNASLVPHEEAKDSLTYTMPSADELPIDLSSIPIRQ